MIQFKAPRVTTYVTKSGRIHGIDTSRPATFRASRSEFVGICGRTLTGGLMMRSSATADAYVTCGSCAARLADGTTVSAATVRRARLAAQLDA